MPAHKLGTVELPVKFVSVSRFTLSNVYQLNVMLPGVSVVSVAFPVQEEQSIVGVVVIIISAE